MHSKWILWLVVIWVGAGYGQNEAYLTDPTSDRITFSATALTNVNPGKFTATGYNLGIWDINYQKNENLSFGAFTVIPLGFVALAPNVRYVLKANDNLYIGGSVSAGFLKTTFVDSDDIDAFYFMGFTPVVTYGNHQSAISFSIPFYYGKYDDSNGQVFTPTIGGSKQISRRIKLNAELISSVTDGSLQKTFTLIYGFRIFSEGGMFGDISFVAPIGEGASEFYEVAPLGFPLLNFGFTF